MGALAVFNFACITLLGFMTEIGLTTETIAKWHEIGVTAEEADAFGLKWLAVSIGVWLVGAGAAQGLGREVAARMARRVAGDPGAGRRPAA